MLPSSSINVRPRLSSVDAAQQSRSSVVRRILCSQPQALPESATNSGMGHRCGRNLSKALRISRLLLSQAAMQAERATDGPELAETLARTLHNAISQNDKACVTSDSDCDSPRASRPSSLSMPSSSSSYSHDLASIDLRLPQYRPRNYEAPAAASPATAAPSSPATAAAGHVLVCQGSKCRAKGALGVLQAASAVIGTSSSVDVMPCKCMGKCGQGVAMKVIASEEASSRSGVPDAPCLASRGTTLGHMYTGIDPSRVGAILDDHFL